MTRGIGIVLACAVICLLCAGCDDDGSSGTMVPRKPFGVIIGSEQTTAQAGPQLNPMQQDYQFAIIWLDGPIAADMYNIYRGMDDTAYVKINSDFIRRGPIFDIPTAPVGLGFIDFTFDIEDTSSYSYYVVASNSYGSESDPSEAITLVPADVDPNAPLTGLTPDQPYRVGLNPTFSWDTISEAASYCVVLEEETPDYGGVLKWIYRTNGPPVSLESTEGVTYLDGMGTSLRPNTDYGWMLFALNANNVAIAAGYVEFSTTSLVATVMDGEQPAGERTVYWDQMDYNGLQTPAGSYELRFTAADYDTTLDFEIVQSGALSDAGQSGSAQDPTGTSVWMETYTHTLGTPIEIRYELPERTRVRMRVFAK